jgi:hypothetical protein
MIINQWFSRTFLWISINIYILGKDYYQAKAQSLLLFSISHLYIESRVGVYRNIVGNPSNYGITLFPGENWLERGE